LTFPDYQPDQPKLTSKSLVIYLYASHWAYYLCKYPGDIILDNIVLGILAVIPSRKCSKIMGDISMIGELLCTRCFSCL
jgi:hypothetical protein